MQAEIDRLNGLLEHSLEVMNDQSLGAGMVLNHNRELEDEIDRLRQVVLEHGRKIDEDRDELVQLRAALAKHHPRSISLIGGRWCPICELLV